MLFWTALKNTGTLSDTVYGFIATPCLPQLKGTSGVVKCTSFATEFNTLFENCAWCYRFRFKRTCLLKMFFFHSVGRIHQNIHPWLCSFYGSVRCVENAFLSLFDGCFWQLEMFPLCLFQ